MPTGRDRRLARQMIRDRQAQARQTAAPPPAPAPAPVTPPAPEPAPPTDPHAHQFLPPAAPEPAVSTPASPAIRRLLNEMGYTPLGGQALPSAQPAAQACLAEQEQSGRSWVLPARDPAPAAPTLQHPAQQHPAHLLRPEQWILKDLVIAAMHTSDEEYQSGRDALYQIDYLKDLAREIMRFRL